MSALFFEKGGILFKGGHYIREYIISGNTVYQAIKVVLNLDTHPKFQSWTDSDEGVGSIIKVLEDHSKLEDTIIIFSIDNGGVPYAGALNYPLRGAKAQYID